LQLFGKHFVEELAARGVAAEDLESIRGVLRVGVDKIAQNLY